MAKIMFSLVVIMGMLFTSFSASATEKTTHKPSHNTPHKAKIMTLIHAGKLLAVPGHVPLEKQTIIVEGRVITAVKAGYLSGKDVNRPDAKVINLEDKFVMPGLMDMHVHLTMVRADDVAADDRALIGVINAKKTLMAGYTTVRDVGAIGYTIFKLRKKIKQGAIEGPRIYAAGQIIGVGPNKDGLECNGTESCRRAARANLQKGADLIKIYASCSGSKFCSGQNGKSMFFDDELEAIFAVAKKFGVKVAAHSHPRDSSLAVLKYDVASIEHGSFLNDKALRIMKKKGVYFVPTMAVHDMLDKMLKDKKLDGRMRAHNQKFLDYRPSMIKKAYDMGVKMATGSDAGVVPHGKNYREIERLVGLGISPMAVLKMATVNGADLLGRSKFLGTIAPHKLADIIAFEHSPLQAIKNIRDIRFVMKNGQIFKQDHK